MSLLIPAIERLSLSSEVRGFARMRLDSGA